jgi:putative membrane protein
VVTITLTDDDRRAIASAIGEAERTTSGEIYCILAGRSADYRETPLAWATLAALVPPLIAVALGWVPWWPETGWLVQGAGTDVARAIFGYAGVQAALFALTAAVVSIPAVKHALTPGPLKRARVRRAAVELFMSHGLQATDARTGVLLYASLAEHRVEVVADQAIHRPRRRGGLGRGGGGADGGARERAGEGRLRRAVGLCGAVLAERFPPVAADRNELPDRIVVI